MSNPAAGLETRDSKMCVLIYLFPKLMWVIQCVLHKQFPQAVRGQTVSRLYHKYLFPLNNAWRSTYTDYITKHTTINITRLAHREKLYTMCMHLGQHVDISWPCCLPLRTIKEQIGGYYQANRPLELLVTSSRLLSAIDLQQTSMLVYIYAYIFLHFCGIAPFS